jgi:hypothetical protein
VIAALAVTGIIAAIWIGKQAGETKHSPAPATLAASGVAAGTGDAEALRRNLELQAQRPDPLATVIRQAVAPNLSDDVVRRLEPTINLVICGGESRSDAAAALQQQGVDLATAQRILEAARRVSTCGPGSSTGAP